MALNFLPILEHHKGFLLVITTKCSLLFFKVLRYSNLLCVLPESGVSYKVISFVLFTLLHYGALLIQLSLKPDTESY